MYLSSENLMEKVVSKENMTKAYQQVVSNKGSAGVDGITVDEIKEKLWESWDTIKEELLKGEYKPQPVRRAEIPKPDGSKRKLGIPTVMDRIIQQAIAQVLSPIYEEVFSDNSYGFRPERSAKDAVEVAKGYVKEGYNIVVDIDLEKFFDTVNQDKLMHKLWKDIADKNLLRQINKFLKAGILVNGIFEKSEIGTPQGGPLSPLLSNIVLDEFDKLLESRNLKFVRYADDSNIYVKSRRAGERVLENITKYLEGKMKLKVNQAKTKVGNPQRRKFLGFTIGKMYGRAMIIINQKSIDKLKDKIRVITNRNTGVSMELRLFKLRQIITGWVNYFKLAEAKKIMRELDEWTRRRLRACIWREWKRPRTKYKNLKSLGVDEQKAYEYANTRKGCWRISNSPILDTTLTNRYFEKIGYCSFSSIYLK